MSIGQDNEGQWDSSQWSSLNYSVDGPTDLSTPERSEILSPSSHFPYSINIGPDGTVQWIPPLGSAELALALSYHFPLYKSLKSKMQAAIVKWADKSSVYYANDQLGIKQIDDADETKTSTTRKTPETLERQPRLRHPKGSISSIRSCDLSGESSRHICKSSKSTSRPTLNGNTAKLGTERTNGESSSTCRQDIPGIINWKVDTGEIMDSTRKKRPYTDIEQIEIAKNRGNVCETHRRRKLKCDPLTCFQNKQRLCQIAGSQLKSSRISTNATRESSQHSNLQDMQDSNTSSLSFPTLQDVPSDISHVEVHPTAAQEAAYLHALLPNIAQDEVIYRQINVSSDNSAATSQTHSSTTPLSIFTGKAASRSDSSIDIVQAMESNEDLDKTSHDRGKLVSENTISPLLADPTARQTYRGLNTTGHLSGIDKDFTNNWDSNCYAQTNLDIDFDFFVDFESCPNSDNFLLPDQNPISASEFTATAVNSISPSSTSSTSIPLRDLHELSSQDHACTSNPEPLENAKSHKIKNLNRKCTPLAQSLDVPSAKRIETLRGTGYIGVIGEDNRVVRDCYPSVNRCSPKRLSGRSMHSNTGAISTDGKEVSHNVIWRNSATSATSRDLKYQGLHTTSSTRRREGQNDSIYGRYSINSTGQESQYNTQEGEICRSPYLEKSATGLFMDTAKRSSVCAGEVFSSLGRGDVGGLLSHFDEQIHALCYEYETSRLPKHTSAQYRRDCVDWKVSIDEVALSFAMAHI